MIRKPVKDGLGNNGRDYICNPAENKFEHKDDLIHESSSVVKPKDPKVGSPEHKLKNPQLYGYRHVPKIEQALYPKLGTSREEKAAARRILNGYEPVRYDKRGYADKATPEQFGALAERLERDRQMTGSDGRYDKPKKKVNAYAEVKIPIPKINFSLLRDPKREEREAALEKMRVSAFTSIPDPDRLRGIGSLATPTVKKLKAADWLKRNQTIYTDRGEEK
jgi:hypothetical protein